MPVLFLLSSPKVGFSPHNVKFGTGSAPRAKFHVYRGRNVGIQPPKLSKFRILAINLPLRGHLFAQFLRNSQILYASMRSFYVFNVAQIYTKKIQISVIFAAVSPHFKSENGEIWCECTDPGHPPRP